MNKLKTEKSYNPKVGFEFFYSDPCGDGLVYFKSEQERDDAVNEAVHGYLDDGWNEEVENVTVGKITGEAAKVDVKIRPSDLDEDNCDEEGVYWDSDWDYTCNYEIKPIGYVCPTNCLLKVGK
jgi:hypothetical protein